MKHLSVHIPRYEIDSVLLLEETTFVVNAEDRIGIVGPNGAGKTTLMKIITGEISGQEISILNTGGMVLGISLKFTSIEKIVWCERI
jgi:ATPase subunit of ABC transporter with duplicated ATPase domains